jgi:WD40 repeat protein
LLRKTYLPMAVLAVLLFIAEAGHAQMQTLITEHFRVHFMPGAEGTARRVAETAEEVFPTLAAAYNYYDDFRTIHVLVLDSSDQLGNGSADYYSNTMAIWATNLDMELRGSHDWIKNVVTHELNHIITLNMARKKWPFQFALISVSRSNSNPDISFQFPLYHMNAPRAWSEGIAQYGAHKFGYDRWDSHRDMLLRMGVLEDDLLSWEEMGSVQDRSGKYYGEMIYNQGYAMLLYIHDQYGAEKVDALTHNVGSMSFDPAIQKVLGVTADQFYKDWIAYLGDNYERLQTEIRSDGFFEGETLSDLNKGILEYHPSYSPDGKKLAYISSDKLDYAIPFLKIHDFETGKTYKSKEYIDSRVSWSPDGEKLVYAKAKGGFNDLYIYDVARDEERRISANLRAKDPAFSPDGKRIVYVHNEDGTNNLAMINSDGTGRVYLTNNNDATQYHGPRFSPDGEWLLFSIFRGADRDIAMMRADSPPRPKGFDYAKPSSDKEGGNFTLKVESDIEEKEEEGIVDAFPDSVAFAHPDSSGFQPLVNSPADERDPYWLPDGSGFLFASDQTGIFNIYKYHMENGEVEQLTNVVGGAFAPTASSTGEVVYSSYHANNYDLYRFRMGEYERDAYFEPVVMRDYRSIYDGPKLSEQFKMGRYSGRNVLRYVPILQVGPTFVGNTFGLNQASGGMQFSSGDMLGGQELTAWGIVGKNMRDATDLNTDFGFFYQRSLAPRVGNNRTFNPSFYISGRRREIDNLIKTNAVEIDTLAVTNIYPIPVDSTTSLLIPGVEQYSYQGNSRQDLFKTLMNQVAVGVDLPLTRSQQVNAMYMFRNYAESWTLREFRNHNQVFLVQDGVDISQQVDAAILGQDTTLVSADNPLSFYNEVDFYSAHTLSLGWSYRKSYPTAGGAFNPTGRALSMVYRYSLPTVADSLAQPTPANGIPGDQFARVPRRFRVNEYVAAYNERIPLPFDNVLSLEAVAAYRNIVLKPSFIEDGGFFEGRFYWPLRYYIGGQNFLSGYPYFTASGSKLIYGKISYSFPVFNRLSSRLLNFNFSKVHAEIFAEAGAVGNFRKFEDVDINTDKFLTDVGGEVRMQLFTFYRIPMVAYFQAAHPLNRDRVPESVGKVDKWRYYFGFGM